MVYKIFYPGGVFFFKYFLSELLLAHFRPEVGARYDQKSEIGKQEN